MERVDPYEEGHTIGKTIKIMKEFNCCTVVTLACVTGCTFERAHHHMKHQGARPPRRGMTRECQEKAFSKLQTFKVKKGLYSKDNRITISQFLKKHPKGKFYCASRGHAFAIIDGVLYDHSDKPRRQITFSYRFYNEDDLKELRNER